MTTIRVHANAATHLNESQVRPPDDRLTPPLRAAHSNCSVLSVTPDWSIFSARSAAIWAMSAKKNYLGTPYLHGEETLAEIGKSYNVSGWTIVRLAE